jgi:50S ribosomal protein L16 3-hydroxylase
MGAIIHPTIPSMTIRPAPTPAFDVTQPLALLGGLSPETFMRRHWQKKPLLIRGAMPDVLAPVSRQALFELAGQETVSSRLVRHTPKKGWTLAQGPFAEAQWPAAGQPGWTLLVQGVDRQVPAAHALLSQFRFVPDARLDDLMVSWASDGGGVGPHFDSYDVFLLQVQGRRRWRIGRLKEPRLLPDAPLKILSHFEAEEEWLLEPGDMLYLPPRWAHDGVAEGDDCMTCSIGFRAPAQDEFAREVLQRLLDAAQDEAEADAQEAASVRHSASPLYRDPKQPATAHPGRIPPAMAEFAEQAVLRLMANPDARACALGEWLSEPAPGTWFEEEDAPPVAAGQGVRLDARTRMLYDERRVFINGESYRAGGRDATLMRHLADRRALSAEQVASLSADARSLLDDWTETGWVLGQQDTP